MMRFHVVDPSDSDLGYGDLADITIQATDGSDPELPKGTELLVPESLITDTLLGVPVADVSAITLDGRTWIPGRVRTVLLLAGSGKQIDFQILGTPPKPMRDAPELRAVRVHVSRIFAVGVDG
jgi:hypothetical protein